MAEIVFAEFPQEEQKPRLIEKGRIGEDETYRLMKERLPDDWVVLRNVFFFSDDEHGYNTSRELDCLLLIPEKGMVVIEIKNWSHGGIIEGQWYFDVNAKPLENARAKDPLVQAQTASKRIYEALVKGEKIERGVPYRQLVVLCTEAEGVRGTVNSHLYLTHEEILSRKSAFKDRILELFKSDKPYRKPVFSKETVEDIRDFLAPTVLFKVPVAYYLDGLQTKSAPVLGMLKHLQESNGNIMVKGCAGSGKTLMLTHEVLRLHKTKPGANILVLCFNRNLEHEFIKTFTRELQKESGKKAKTDLKNGPLSVMTFLAYVSGVVGKPVDVKEIDKCMFGFQSRKKYDYIFFDEAQDMGPGWEIAIAYSLKEDGKAYFFADSNQSLYNGSELPQCQTVVTLTENMRNCKEVADLSNEFLPQGLEKPGVLDLEGGKTVLCKPIPDVRERAQKVREIIEGIHKQYHVYNRDIVVLSPWRISKESNESKEMCAFRYLGDCVDSAPGEDEAKEACNKRHTDCKKQDWPRVLGDTIKTFKGLEAIHVIVTDVVEPETPYFSEDDMYVACTRARYSLHIIPVDDKAYNYLQKKLAVLKQ